MNELLSRLLQKLNSPLFVWSLMLIFSFALFCVFLCKISEKIGACRQRRKYENKINLVEFDQIKNEAVIKSFIEKKANQLDTF